MFNSTSLIIHSAKKSDSGKYFCIAKSSIGSDIVEEASAKVEVLGINFFIYKYLGLLGNKLIEYGPSNSSMLIGSNVQMPCKISDDYTNNHDISINWFRNVCFFFIVF